MLGHSAQLDDDSEDLVNRQGLVVQKFQIKLENETDIVRFHQMFELIVADQPLQYLIRFPVAVFPPGLESVVRLGTAIRFTTFPFGVLLVKDHLEYLLPFLLNDGLRLLFAQTHSELLPLFDWVLKRAYCK